MKKTILFLTFLAISEGIFAQAGKWYTQGNFEPKMRLQYTIENTLDFDRENSPVVIPREEFPMPDIHEMWITIVDPQLEPSPEPSAELLDRQGGHQLRKENNGHAIFHQLDDLDKDGIWDELFFQLNLKAKRKKDHLYLHRRKYPWMEPAPHARKYWQLLPPSNAILGKRKHRLENMGLPIVWMFSEKAQTCFNVQPIVHEKPGWVWRCL